jgi:uncharacterized damage-inducible protein DinB
MRVGRGRAVAERRSASSQHNEPHDARHSHGCVRANASDHPPPTPPRTTQHNDVVELATTRTDWHLVAQRRMSVLLLYFRAVPRIDPDPDGDELTSLSQFLDFHRATLVDKVSSLSTEQLARRAVPSSAITLGGMLKHLALVEDDWFQVKFLGRPEVEPWASAPFDVDPDWDWHSAVNDTPEDLLRLYDAACARSRAVVAEVGGDLDMLSVVTDPRSGGRISLRWILLHMIEETARHNGHVDLIREAIDGSVGE